MVAVREKSVLEKDPDGKGAPLPGEERTAPDGTASAENGEEFCIETSDLSRQSLR
jgi:hypothetical protein